LLLSSPKQGFSVTCRRSVVWRFLKAQNGTYRFGNFGDPHYATSNSLPSQIPTAP